MKWQHDTVVRSWKDYTVRSPTLFQHTSWTPRKYSVPWPRLKMGTRWPSLVQRQRPQFLLYWCFSVCHWAQTYIKKNSCTCYSKLYYPVHCHLLYCLVCSSIASKWNTLWNKDNKVSYIAVTYKSLIITAVRQVILSCLSKFKIHQYEGSLWTQSDSELSLSTTHVRAKTQIWLHFIFYEYLKEYI
jgi:hypothetical protein